jgi:hypothetical protein
MTDKSSFTAEEWKLLLESVMMASLAVTAAEPSGLWGLSWRRCADLSKPTLERCCITRRLGINQCADLP